MRESTKQLAIFMAGFAVISGVTLASIWAVKRGTFSADQSIVSLPAATTLGGHSRAHAVFRFKRADATQTKTPM